MRFFAIRRIGLLMLRPSWAHNAERVIPHLLILVTQQIQLALMTRVSIAPLERRDERGKLMRRRLRIPIQRVNLAGLLQNAMLVSAASAEKKRRHFRRKWSRSEDSRGKIRRNTLVKVMQSACRGWKRRDKHGRQSAGVGVVKERRQHDFVHNSMLIRGKENNEDV
jgi:hypothetical protein